LAIEYNVYCDESGHLEHDQQVVMVLGALWCPVDLARGAANRLREIKAKHGLSPTYELKWSKVSPGQLGYYEDVLDYYLDATDLNFRALIVPDKGKLRHDKLNQTHDTFYYKMYFELLKQILAPKAAYRIYLDIKDTRSADKTRKLHDVLANNMYDFDREIVRRIQTVRSHEVEPMQLADFLIGLVAAANRNVIVSPAKAQLIARMRQRTGYSLAKTTLLSERKVNLFRWTPSEWLEL
jgi:hypothetical protein